MKRYQKDSGSSLDIGDIGEDVKRTKIARNERRKNKQKQTRGKKN
jgi:hypothetical protein